MPTWTRWGPWLIAAVGGGLWAACFAVNGRTVAPWIALVPLFLALAPVLAPLGSPRPRRPGLRAFGLGWLHGTVFWLVSIPWIAPTLETFGGLPLWLCWLLLVALALYLGVYTGVFTGLGFPVWRRAVEAGGWPATLAVLLGLPGLWVTLEWVRGWLFSGFPWNLAGYAWTEVPGALPLGAWIGVWGVGFLAILVNAAVALSLTRRMRGAPGMPGVGAAVGSVLGVLLLLSLAARFAVPAGEPLDPARGPATAIRLVQPAIYNQVEYDPETTRESYRRLLRMTEEACDRPGAVVIWPESATWPFEMGEGGLLEANVTELARRTGCAIVLNSTHRTGRPHPTVEDGEIYYNSAFLVAPDGSRVRYDKRHLVPFGEYVPLADVFSFIDSLARSAGDYSAAEDVTLLPVPGSRGDELGMAICFEVTFPAEVAELARAGATALVTITNDAWYGDTWAPWQHFTAARWRAAETRRPLFRAAITGVSGVIAPDGSVRQILGVGETGTLRATLDGRSDLSPFARAPWLVLVLSGLLALTALVVTAVARSPIS